MFSETLFRAEATRNGRQLGASCLESPYIGPDTPVCTAWQNSAIDAMMQLVPEIYACARLLELMRSGAVWTPEAMCTCVSGIPQDSVLQAERDGILVCKTHSSLRYSLAQFMSGCGASTASFRMFVLVFRSYRLQ